MLTAVVILIGVGVGCGFAENKPLGWLSSQFEVANGGAGTVSSGKHKQKDKETGEVTEVEDKGGISYGSFQLASKVGVGGSSVKSFVAEYYADDFREPDPDKPGSFRDLTPGTPEFGKKWKEVVKREGEEFTDNEREFIYDTHYAPVAAAVKEKLGLDVDARSDALRNVLWSTAVQNGPPSDPKGSAVRVMENALKKWDKKQLSEKPGADGKGGVSDEDLINAIYDERSRTDENGKMVYFGNLDLSKRFKQERKDVQGALTKERQAKDAELHKTVLDPIGKSIGIIVTPDHRRPNNLIVPRGQVTFDGEGNEGGPYHSRRPHVPSDSSGVTIGRGYDMKARTAKEIHDDLRAAGVSEDQANLYARAAGLSGDDAKAFLDEHGYVKLIKAAGVLGLKGIEVNQYLKANTLDEITQEQQQKLFNLTYGRMEAAVKDKFSDYEKYPKSAQEAVTDMAYNLGLNGLLTKFPKFVDAVKKQDWDQAAQESKRKGVGFERNQAVRELLEQAAKPAADAPMPLP